jgi:putative copper resistance protein D
MKQWASALLLLCVIAVSFVVLSTSPAQGQSHSGHHFSGDLGIGQDADPTYESQWEGSAQGTAYSEFNHRFVGLLVLLFGLGELGYALRYQLPFWIRFVLPSALSVIGPYLLIWSDHEAWPIGSLTLIQTFSGQDPEIIQHKFYGVFGSIAAVSEMLRRTGWVRHPAWAAPLFVLGLGGSLLLFVHSHEHQPGNHMIELHHALLGTFGIGAAVSNAMVSWASDASDQTVNRWEVAWAGFAMVIGLQLLIYNE